MTPAEWKEFLAEANCTEADVKSMIAHLNKRFWMFMLLSLIPGVGIITAGCAVYCFNNANWWKSHGNTTGNNIVRFVIMLFGGIIPPIIEVWLFSKIDALGNKVLGL